MSINIRKIALFSGILLVSQNAFAHSPIKGIGTLFNGILHPFLIPSHVLVILALGFWIGQLQPKKHQYSILVFLLTMIVALGLTAFNISLGDNGSSIILILAILIGLMTLSAAPASVTLTAVVCIIVALLTGLDSQLEDLSGSVKLISQVGNTVGSYLMLLYAVALSETLSIESWQKIGIRILSSWLSASALMVLALHLSSN